MSTKALSKKRLDQLQAEMYVLGFKDGAACLEKNKHKHLHEKIVAAYDLGYKRGAQELNIALDGAENSWGFRPSRQ